MSSPPRTTTHLFILDQGMSDKTSSSPPNGRIITCHANGSSPRDLVTGLHHFPDGIAVTKDHNYIFWTNMGGSSPSSDEHWANTGYIQRCNIDGSNVTTVFEPGKVTHTPKQLAISETAKKLYWCDREGLRILRSDFDGGNVETLVRNGDFNIVEHRQDYLRWCVGIALDEASGYIYWTQKGSPKGGQGKILRCPIDKPISQGGAEFDPNSREDIELLFDGLPEPIDLSLDLKGGWIYWTDRGDVPFGNSVNRAKIPGPKLKGKEEHERNHEILVRKLHEGIGLALDVDNGHMYMTDLLGGVYRTNLEGGDKTILFPDLGTITGIAVTHLDD